MIPSNHGEMIKQALRYLVALGKQLASKWNGVGHNSKSSSNLDQANNKSNDYL